MNRPMRKILVLGIGNTHLRDGGVGVYVARVLRNLVDLPWVAVEETDLSGVELPAMIDGYDEVVIVDGIETETGMPGNIYRFEPSGARSLDYASTVHLDLHALGDRLGMGNIYIPGRIVVYAVEVEDVQSFGKGCTGEVTKAIPRLAHMIRAQLTRELSHS